MHPQDNAAGNKRGKQNVGKKVHSLSDSADSQQCSQRQRRGNRLPAEPSRSQKGQAQSPKPHCRMTGCKRTVQTALIGYYPCRRKGFKPAEFKNFHRPGPTPKTFQYAVYRQQRPQHQSSESQEHYPPVYPRNDAAVEPAAQPQAENDQTAKAQGYRNRQFKQLNRTIVLQNKTTAVVKQCRKRDIHRRNGGNKQKNKKNDIS